MKLIPAQFVRPFVKSNKNDFLDAEAIAEAVDRQNMRFVPIKTDDQLDLQAIHRVRDRLIARRTSVINQLRAFLLERGMTFAKTPFKLKVAMPDILENAEANLTSRMRDPVSLLWSEWKDLEQQIVGGPQQLSFVVLRGAAGSGLPFRAARANALSVIYPFRLCLITAPPAFFASPLIIPSASSTRAFALGVAIPFVEVGLVLPLTSIFRGFIAYLRREIVYLW